MSHIAQARTKTESLLTANYILPTVLAVNSAALVALEQLGGIPTWLKTAAALFLAF